MGKGKKSAELCSDMLSKC